MTSELIAGPNPARAVPKSFPWRCPRCRQKEVYRVAIPHQREVLHDGRLHTVMLPQLHVPRCTNCGELVFDNVADEQIREALRVQLHLLAPAEIRTNRTILALSRQDLSAHLGVAEEMLRYWEEGLMIQSRSHDNLLRLYFGLPQARAALAAPASLPQFGVCVVS